MKTILILLISIICLKANNVPLQTPTCNCTYPLKTNTVWCKGSKGGEYCINKKGTKTYKPKIKSK
jgi:hypothetical protein